VEIAKESTRGSLILFLGNLTSTAFAAANVLIVARLLGPDSYGEYSLALAIPTVFILFAGFGVTSAVTRYAAYHISRGETTRAVALTKHATLFMLVSGVGLALVNYYGASYFSQVIFHRQGLTPLIQLVSLFIIGQTLALSSTSAFVGWSSMAAVSGFSITQAILKFAISPALILLGLGVYGAMVGHVVSFLVQGAAATLFLYAIRLRPAEEGDIGFLQDIKTLLGYGLPIFAGGIFAGVAAQYLTIVLGAIAANTTIGYYSAGQNILAGISVISAAVSTVLFRSFSALNGLREDLTLALDYAVRYVSYLLTPVVFFLIAAAGNLFNLLYSPFFSPGIVLLQLLAFANLPVAFGMPVIPSFLNGVGRSRTTMILSIVGAVSLVVGGPALAISFHLGVEGIIYALLLSNVLSTALGLGISVKHLHAQVLFKPLVSIVVSCFFASVAVVLLPTTRLPSALNLVLDIATFVFVYLTIAPLMKAINEGDASRLQAATEGIGFAGGILKLVLDYEKWLLRLTGQTAASTTRTEKKRSIP